MGVRSVKMVNSTGLIAWLYDLGMWLSRFMYLHILWLAFTLLGLGFFGIAPATAALVAVTYKWFEDDSEIPIFKNFFSVYKQEFFKANGIGWIMFALNLFLYIDIRIARQLIQNYFFYFSIIFIALFLFVVFLYIFTVFARYDLKFSHYFRQAFLITIVRPFESIAMPISLVLISILYYYLPALPILMGSSLAAFPVVWFGYRACVQVEDKKTRLKKGQEEKEMEAKKDDENN